MIQFHCPGCGKKFTVDTSLSVRLSEMQWQSGTESRCQQISGQSPTRRFRFRFHRSARNPRPLRRLRSDLLRRRPSTTTHRRAKCPSPRRSSTPVPIAAKWCRIERCSVQIAARHYKPRRLCRLARLKAPKGSPRGCWALTSKIGGSIMDAVTHAVKRPKPTRNRTRRATIPAAALGRTRRQVGCRR